MNWMVCVCNLNTQSIRFWKTEVSHYLLVHPNSSFFLHSISSFLLYSSVLSHHLSHCASPCKQRRSSWVGKANKVPELYHIVCVHIVCVRGMNMKSHIGFASRRSDTDMSRITIECVWNAILSNKMDWNGCGRRKEDQKEVEREVVFALLRWSEMEFWENKT